MQTLIGLGLGLVLFLCTITAYTLGIRHGKEISNGNVPQVQINPVKPIVEAVKEHKEVKAQQALGEELTDIMSYSREAALNAVKKER